METMNDITETEKSSENTTAPFAGGMLEDNTGGTSSMRVFMLVGGGFILLVHGFAYIWCVVHGLPLPDIPLQWGLAFSALIAGKVGQRVFEKS